MTAAGRPPAARCIDNPLGFFDGQLTGRRCAPGTPGQRPLLVRQLRSRQNDVLALLAVARNRLDVGPLDRSLRRWLGGWQAQRLRLSDRRKQALGGE